VGEISKKSVRHYENKIAFPSSLLMVLSTFPLGAKFSLDLLRLKSALFDLASFFGQRLTDILLSPIEY
jgi:hypothetical protein